MRVRLSKVSQKLPVQDLPSLSTALKEAKNERAHHSPRTLLAPFFFATQHRAMTQDTAPEM